jgi:peptide/nickel transport system permease protein
MTLGLIADPAAPAAAGQAPIQRGRGRYLAREAGRLLIALWFLLTATFLMIHLVPGNPVLASLGSHPPPALVAARTRALDLNRPLISQYLHYLTALAHGQFGTSILTGQPVSEVIRTQLPATVELAVLAFALTVVIAVPAGVALAAVTRGGRRLFVETTFTSFSVVIITVPTFLLSEALVYIFAIRLGWFPIAGKAGLSSYVLPVVSLGAGPALFFARIIRTEVTAALAADYVRTARAKRLPGWRIMVRDVLPNALTATLTLGGMLLTGLIASTVLVEQIFSWPGLGATMVSSILGKDYPVVQAVVLVYGSAVILVNFLVDITLVGLDPRTAGTESS